MIIMKIKGGRMWACYYTDQVNILVCVKLYGNNYAIITYCK